MTELQELVFYDCKGVTDASVKVLAGMKQLQWLDVTDTQLTAAGIAELKKALPGTHFFIR